MKTKNIVGIALIAIIFALLFLVLSQESSKKVDVVEKVEEKVAKVEPKVEKSEEEKYVEDLKKQAGANSDYEVSKYYKTSCSSCHGKVGEGTKVAPMIAGKSYEDIVKRLDDYKHNRVPNSLMVGLLNNISDEDLKKLALEIASFK